jgi:hypothetical protein
MTMTAALRAVADRLVLDTANLKYLATILPDAALDRPIANSDWTVRQVLAHFGATEHLHADICGRLLAGEEPQSPGFDINVFNAEAVAGKTNASLGELLDAIDTGRARVLQCYEKIPPAALSTPFRNTTLLGLLDGWSRHYARHAMDLLDTVPEVRFDSMVLNWVLHADLRGTSAEGQQRRLFEEVREKFAQAEQRDD